jgi:hypothetical protein
MCKYLKSHPFAVETFFESSLVLTYAVAKEELQGLIPECLQLDTHQDWAFVAVAMVKTQKLRPKGFPAFLGNDFFLIGYRVFVRYTTSEGKKLRGLYILKSETNSKKMSFMGNIFTHYNYTTIDVGITNTPTSIEITSQKAKLLVKTDFSSPEIALPSNSPFKDWKEARRFAGPLPFTFTYNQVSKEVLLIEGVRQDWIPKPVSVLADSVGYLQTLNFKKIVLANAFIVQNIPYHWKKGKIDIWKG